MPFISVHFCATSTFSYPVISRPLKFFKKGLMVFLGLPFSFGRQKKKCKQRGSLKLFFLPALRFLFVRGQRGHFEAAGLRGFLYEDVCLSIKATKRVRGPTDIQCPFQTRCSRSFVLFWNFFYWRQSRCGTIGTDRPSKYYVPKQEES